VRGSEFSCALITLAEVVDADAVGTEMSEAREKLNEGRETAPPPKESTELDDDVVVVVEKTGTLLDGTPNAVAPTGGAGIALAFPLPPPPPNGIAPPNGDSETPPSLLLPVLLVFPH